MRLAMRLVTWSGVPYGLLKSAGLVGGVSGGVDLVRFPLVCSSFEEEVRGQSPSRGRLSSPSYGIMIH